MNATTNPHSTPSRRGLLAAALAAGAGLGLAATGVAPGRAYASADWQPLRVATFNIHHGASPSEVLDLERTARVIERIGADVVALQEVDRHWSARSALVDQAAWLGERLDLHDVFGANLDQDPAETGQPRRQYGTAVLSRWPILSWTNTHLPKAERGEQRGLLRATLNVRGTRVTIAGTHLTHNNDLERQEQADRIVQLLGTSPERTVLMGDLNATPEKPEIRTLTAVLPDVWDSVGAGDGFTYGAVDPYARIDYVLASPDVRAVSAEVVTIDPEASDHLPVVADLLVPRVVGA